MVEQSAARDAADHREAVRLARLSRHFPIGALLTTVFVLLTAFFAPLPWMNNNGAPIIGTGISTHGLTLAAGPIETAEYSDAH